MSGSQVSLSVHIPVANAHACLSLPISAEHGPIKLPMISKRPIWPSGFPEMAQSIQNNPRRAKINLCMQVAERSQGAHGLAGAGARAWVPSQLWMILGRAAMVDTGRAEAGSVSGPHSCPIGWT